MEIAIKGVKIHAEDDVDVFVEGDTVTLKAKPSQKTEHHYHYHYHNQYLGGSLGVLQPNINPYPYTTWGQQSSGSRLAGMQTSLSGYASGQPH